MALGSGFSAWLDRLGMSDEPIGGPTQPPEGMEHLWSKPSEIDPCCQHAEHSILYLPTVLLIALQSGVKTVQCKVCNQTWEE